MAKPKILVAEDDKVTQALYRQGLPEKLCELKITSNGEEALTVYEEWKPDIILLDYSMPITNGFQALKTIRKSDKETTIIMITSTTDKEYIIACAKVGIQGYIVKPFKTNEVAKKIIQFYSAHKHG